MKPLKKKVSITLDEDIIEKIQIIMERHDCSFYQYVNLVLKQHIESLNE